MNGDARHQSHAARRRALAVFALVVGGLAAGLGVIAFTVASPASGVVLDVEPATLDVPPSPTPTTTLVTADDPSTVPESEPLPVPTPEAAPESGPKIPPTMLTIGDLALSTEALRPVGLDDAGDMEIPGIEEIGWYLHGAAPGRPGATVLVAHVWWGDTAGPFHKLGALDPGAVIEVGVDGAVHDYVVVERAMYDKESLPGNLWRNSGPETLVLITCGGDLNQATRRYKQNIVVYAMPVMETEAS